MPSHKHREKRLRQAEKRQAANVHVKSQLQTLSKKVRAATAQGDAAQSEKTLKEATSALDKAAKSGRLHKKTAARRIARLTKQVNKSSQGGAAE